MANTANKESYVLANEKVSTTLDAKGRIVSLINKETGTELLNHPGLEDNWKIMLLGEGHRVHYILGKDQTPASCEASEHADGGGSVRFHYDKLRLKDVVYDIGLTFQVSLSAGSNELHYTVDLTNGHRARVREVWFPILGGFNGFEYEGESNIAHLACSGHDAKDVIRRGMPDAEYIFCVEEETFRMTYPHSGKMGWLDLYCGREGLYMASYDKSCAFTDFRIEKYPPEKGWVADYIAFPEDTPRWTRMLAGKMTEIDPGETWRSQPTVLSPHTGDWHAAADQYRAWARSWQSRPQKPPVLDNYVGWQHILGMTYLGEVYHTFEQAATVAIAVNERSGLDILNYYGHEAMGSEGDGSSMAPADELGGPEGFRRMCGELHRHGMKVVVFNHRHSLISMEDPQYAKYEPWAIKDKYGHPRQEVWWKTTIESMSHYGAGVHYEGHGPISVPICPHCDEWWETCFEEFAKLIELGLDGVQLDLLASSAQICYADNHGHKPGVMPIAVYFERLAALRAKLKAIKPDFLFIGEEFPDCYFQFMDLPYSRYRGESGYQMFHYTFPEAMENVAVDAYAYDQANKALLLGYGMNTEMWVLKKSLLDAGPAFMDYIGSINALKRKYADYLIRGTFLDTLRAHVTGNVAYGVHEGRDGLAIVLWNKGNQPETCTAAGPQDSGFEHGIVCVPGEAERETALPVSLTLPPHRTAVIIVSGRKSGAVEANR